MEIVNIQLVSKNNKKNGIYLYRIVVKKDGLYYFCGSIMNDGPIKAKDIDVNSLVIGREIPKEFWEVNGIK